MALTETEEVNKVGKVRQLYGVARQSRAQRVEAWNRSYRIIHNRTWSELRDSWLPSPAASEIYPIVCALVGWMTDQRPGFTVTPAVEPHSQYAQQMYQVGKDLETTIKATWVEHHFDAEIEKVLWDAMIYGTGFFKVVWDAALVEGMGDAVMRRCDPFAMFVDPTATSFDDADYVLEVRNVSMEELNRRFPGSRELLDEGPMKDSNVDERDDLYNSNRMAKANPGGISGAPPKWGPPGKAREHAGDTGSDDEVTLYEAWIRDSDLWADEDGETYVQDKWNVVVVAGNRVLLDETAENIFGHGRHPYVRYTMMDMGDFWGVSLVEHLAPLQIAINRLLASMQSHAELTGNPVFVEDARSGIPRTKITNKPGQRLVKNTGSEVGWINPPTMGQETLQLVQLYLGEMERVSGLSAIVRGATPSGRNAQGVLDSVQESAFVRVRLSLRNLERALRISTELLASLIVENYTEPRMVSITGPEGQASTTALKAQHFYMPTPDGGVPMRFRLWVQAGSMFPISRSARAAEADTLFAMGALDEQAVLEAHDYPDRINITQRVIAKKEAGLMQPPGARQRSGR